MKEEPREGKRSSRNEKGRVEMKEEPQEGKRSSKNERGAAGRKETHHPS